jgi:hypothetical protein
MNSESLKEFSETSQLEVSDDIKIIIQKLSEVSNVSDSKRKTLKSGIKYLVASVVFFVTGTTFINFFLILIGYRDIAKAYNFDAFVRNIAVVLMLIALYKLVRWILKWNTKTFDSDLGHLVVPALLEIAANFDINGKVELKFDLAEYIEKKIGEEEVSYLLHQMYEDYWFSGSFLTKNGNQIEWSVSTYLTKTRPITNNVEGDSSVIKYDSLYEVKSQFVTFSQRTDSDQVYWDDYKRSFDLSTLLGLMKKADSQMANPHIPS